MPDRPSSGPGAFQNGPILQRRLPPHVRPGLRLPGTGPVPLAEWLIRDEAYAAQMRLRECLIEKRHDDVIALRPAAEEAADELFATVLAEARNWAGFSVGRDEVACPDGRVVPIVRADPLATLGRLVQADLCLMVRPEGEAEHRLEGAVLCFPSSWLLAEKLGRPLTGVHRPVPAYDASLARRVQRLFDAIRPEQPLMRHNLLWKARADLFQPLSEHAPRPAAEEPRYLRSERQVLRRLPRTGAVVFAIHTIVVERAVALRAPGMAQDA